MNMRFYCVRDRVKQKQFRGASNLADYFTIPFPPVHYKEIRGTYVLDHICFVDTFERSSMVCTA